MYLLNKIAKTTSIQVVIGIGSLEDLLKLVLSIKNVEILKCSLMEVTLLEILTCRQEYFFNKQVEYCESVR